MQAYWQVGEPIVREELRQGGRVGYGDRAVARRAADRGFGRRDIYRMVRCAVLADQLGRRAREASA